MKRIFYYLTIILTLLNINVYSQSKKKSESPSKPTIEKVNEIKKVEIDSTFFSIEATVKAIRIGLTKVIKNQLKAKSIIISKEHPLVVFLKIMNKPSLDSINYYKAFGEVDNRQVLYCPSITINANNLSTGTEGLSGSAQDGGNAVPLFGGSLSYFIESGDLTLTGDYIVNGKSIYFENEKVVYEDNVNSGIFSEGAICYFDGLKYKHSSGIWSRQNK